MQNKKKQVQVTRAVHRPNNLKQIQNVKPMTFHKSSELLTGPQSGALQKKRSENGRDYQLNINLCAPVKRDFKFNFSVGG